MSGADVEPDSSHVASLYRAATYGRTFLTWYIVYGAAWLAVLAIGAPFAGTSLWLLGTYQPLPLLYNVLEPFALIVATFVALPIAIGAVLQWRRCVRALSADLPIDSPWDDHLLRPFRRQFRWTAAMLILGASTGLGFYVVAYASSGLFNAGTYTSADTTTFSGVAALLVLGTTGAQTVAQLVVPRAFASLIAGSEIPPIDRARRGAVEVATWSAIGLVVTGVAAALLSTFAFALGAAGPVVGDLSLLALLSPVGLLAGAALLRKGFTRWLGLAERLVGKPRAV